MRSVIFAAIAAAAVSTVASAAFAQGGGYPGYDNYRSYDRGSRSGVDMGAIRDKCENDWRRAIYKGNTGDNSHRSYIAKCVDRDASATAWNNRRNDDRRYYDNRYDRRRGW